MELVEIMKTSIFERLNSLKLVNFLEKYAETGKEYTKVLKKITGDDCIWEKAPLIELTKEKQLMAYKHYGFWQPMDTLRDKVYLHGLWDKNQALWKVWK